MTPRPGAAGGGPFVEIVADGAAGDAAHHRPDRGTFPPARDLVWEYVGDMDAPARTMNVVVRGRAGGLRQDIEAGRHHLVSDEPVGLGGMDDGPTPYDLLTAALGSCTAMTLQMYAQRNGWPLEAIEVRLSHAKIHARDCADCETKEGRIDRIERQIVLQGALDEAQRARLLEIADRCPVHRTLTSEIEISTRLL